LHSAEAFPQSKHFLTMADSAYLATKTDSLKRAFPHIKGITPDYETAFYTALAHYPELQQTRIRFVQKPIKTTMATRPATSIFKSRNKRGYRLYANNKKEFSGVYLSQLNFDQQVGIFGHELAHIVDFTQKNPFRLLGNGIGYLFPKYRKQYEAKTDIRTIKHGLGWQLYDFTDFIMNRSHASEKYKLMKKKIYMNEKQIELIITQAS